MGNIVVIGGGLMGCAAAWELSKAGEKVILLEAQSEEYSTGSSIGNSRITRCLEHQGSILSYLQILSIQKSKELISFLNTQQVSADHTMEEIYKTFPVTSIYEKNTQSNSVDSLVYDENLCDYLIAEKAEALEKLAISIDETEIIFQEYKEYSGIFNPKKLIEKLRLGIKLSSNEILYQHKVVDLVKNENGYSIEVLDEAQNKTSTLKAAKVIVASGAWSAEILKNIAPYFRKLLKPKSVFNSYFKINDRVYNGFSKDQRDKIVSFMPIFYRYTDRFYAMIDNFNVDESPIFKTGCDAFQRRIKQIDEAWDLEPSPEVVAKNKNHLHYYFKMLNISIDLNDIELIENKACVYTISTNEKPFVTQLISTNNHIDENAVVIAGLSGLGAKGSLGYGYVATQLLLKNIDKDPMFLKTMDELSTSRLLEELKILNL